LSDLNFKEVEIENLKKSVVVQNDELNILRDQMNDKDKTITQYQRTKSKLQEDFDLLKNKLVGKSYLIGARHLIWDQIITKVTRIWDYFKLMDEESTLVKKADKDIQQAFHDLGNSPQLARKIIKVLNSKSKEELSKRGIKYHTNMVMETKNIFTKRTFDSAGTK
jgi:hypothetical protein